ncbi:MAG: disulfide bond formation protein B [Gammaproteobacteria bacterium]|nr:disulfide bond formation protein B [Gammaproteobacteria bacterium]
MRFLGSLLISRRRPFALFAMVCIGLLTFGYYLQAYAGQEPCPLCVFQRVAYITIVAIALGATLHGPRLVGASVYCSLIAITALIGAAIAGRQTWLQHLPEDLVPECGPGLDFMMDAFPLGETVRKVFQGSGECAKVDWTLLGLSIAEWSLLWFLAIAASSVALMFVRASQRSTRVRYRKPRNNLK